MWRWAVCMLLAMLGLPTVARAHLVTTGLGPLYDGMTHLAVSPADLLLVVSLALFAGLGGAARGRSVLAALPLAWLVGGLVGLRFVEEIAAPVASALALLLLGVLVAADARLPRWASLGVVAVAGIFYGALNGSALSAARSGPLGLFGIIVAVTVLTTLISASVVSMRPGWMRTVVRVAGSWIAAVGLLMVGWALRL